MSAFRPIDGTGFERPERRDLGVKPALQWIAINDLVVDETYQRRISAEGVRSVKKIAAAFDWMFFSPVIVAPIEGRKFAIIDGQHRTTAAKIVGIDSVPCQLVLADPRQQAAAFAEINGGVQRATSMQIYHAAKAAGAPWAVEVAAVAEAAGVEVLRYAINATSPARPRHSTMSATTIRAIIARYGREVSTLALLCITRSSLGDDPAAIGQMWMRAIAWALFDRPTLAKDEASLFRFFDDLDAGAGVAASMASTGFGGSSAGRLAAWLGAQLDAAFPQAVAA